MHKKDKRKKVFWLYRWGFNQDIFKGRTADTPQLHFHKYMQLIFAHWLQTLTDVIFFIFTLYNDFHSAIETIPAAAASAGVMWHSLHVTPTLMLV